MAEYQVLDLYLRLMAYALDGPERKVNERPKARMSVTYFYVHLYALCRAHTLPATVSLIPPMSAIVL